MAVHHKEVLLHAIDLAVPPDDYRRVIRDDWDALTTLARGIVWQPSPKAYFEISRHASAENRPVQTVRHDVLTEALQRALGQQYAPQTVRLGSSWVVDDEGHETVIVPARLRPEEFGKWIGAETRSAADAFLEMLLREGWATDAREGNIAAGKRTISRSGTI